MFPFRRSSPGKPSLACSLASAKVSSAYLVSAWYLPVPTYLLPLFLYLYYGTLVCTGRRPYQEPYRGRSTTISPSVLSMARSHERLTPGSMGRTQEMDTC